MEVEKGYVMYNKRMITYWERGMSASMSVSNGYGCGVRSTGTKGSRSVPGLNTIGESKMVALRWPKETPSSQQEEVASRLERSMPKSTADKFSARDGRDCRTGNRFHCPCLFYPDSSHCEMA